MGVGRLPNDTNADAKYLEYVIKNTLGARGLIFFILCYSMEQIKGN